MLLITLKSPANPEKIFAKLNMYKELINELSFFISNENVKKAKILIMTKIENKLNSFKL